MQYLGDFRGTHLTRVKINVAKYSDTDHSLSVAREIKVSHNSREFHFNTSRFNRYLIIIPEGEFRQALGPFIAWKESLGFVVEVEEIPRSLVGTDVIKEIVADYYKNPKVHFVMLVGTPKLMPINTVRTRFSYMTPSDLPYFTFGPKFDDYIPDVFASRVVVETPEQLRRILWKSSAMSWGFTAILPAIRVLWE